jgi:hypothetical protein
MKTVRSDRRLWDLGVNASDGSSCKAVASTSRPRHQSVYFPCVRKGVGGVALVVSCVFRRSRPRRHMLGDKSNGIDGLTKVGTREGLGWYSRQDVECQLSIMYCETLARRSSWCVRTMIHKTWQYFKVSTVYPSARSSTTGLHWTPWLQAQTTAVSGAARAGRLVARREPARNTIEFALKYYNVHHTNVQ